MLTKGKCILMVLLDTTGKYMGLNTFPDMNQSEQYAHRFNDF